MQYGPDSLPLHWATKEQLRNGCGPHCSDRLPKELPSPNSFANGLCHSPTITETSTSMPPLDFDDRQTSSQKSIARSASLCISMEICPTIDHSPYVINYPCFTSKPWTDLDRRIILSAITTERLSARELIALSKMMPRLFAGLFLPQHSPRASTYPTLSR